MFLNRVTLMGTVKGDPKISEMPSGVQKASFRIVITEKRQDRTFTTTASVGAYGAAAKECLSLVPGEIVFVDGRLSNYSYTDKNGEKAWSSEIAVSFATGIQCAGVHAGNDADNNDQKQW